MATSATMQFCMISSVRGSSYGRLPMAGVGRIRCLAEDQTEGEKPTTSTYVPPAPTSVPQPPKPPSPPKMSTKFSDVLGFSGPAPERINGRLAMVGFVSAMAVEVVSGNDLFSQISTGGVPWFVFASGLLSAASLIPLFSGVSVESKSKGVMSSSAEMWNGRAAMLGLVALALTEYLKGGPLV